MNEYSIKNTNGRNNNKYQLVKLKLAIYSSRN
jgi:hypothetical protein